MTSWRDDASCLGMPTELFFPELGQTGVNRETPGREVCDICPVAQECLDDAIANGMRYGIWGGTNGDQRRRLRKRERAQALLAQRRAS